MKDGQFVIAEKDTSDSKEGIRQGRVLSGEYRNLEYATRSFPSIVRKLGYRGWDLGIFDHKGKLVS